MQISEKLLDCVESYQDDFEAFAKDCLIVRNHDTAKLVPFKMRRGQAILNRVVEKQLAELGYVRIIISKSRRHGTSTYSEGRGYHETSLRTNRDAFVVAHESKSTEKLFSMTKLYHERNPLAPATKKSNSKEIIFDNNTGTGLKSSMGLATAGTPESARGSGIHFLHDSEEAFWPEGERSLLALMQCVPDPPARSFVFRESTSNGFGNTFQVDAFKAYAEGRFPYYEEDGKIFAYHNPDSDSDWVVVFLPWFIHESYVREFKDDAEKQALIERVNTQIFAEEDLRWVDSEAKKLQKKHGLTWEQLNWMFWAIENKCRGNIDTFHQEYPANFLESFLSQGSNVFGRVLCDYLEEQCSSPAHVGEVMQQFGKPKIKLNKNGKFQRWEKYDSDETYFMTIDVAGGKKQFDESDKKAKEPDRTSIDVWKRRTGDQVAQWNGHIDYDRVADLAELIGDMYGRCTAVTEANNHGHAVIAFLKKANYPMWGRKPKEPGWLTTSVTKPLMIDSLYQQSRDGDLQIKSKATVEEMRTYIEESGKFGAASGCKDDRVITAAIASQMMLLLPRHINPQQKKQPAGFTNWLNKDK